MNALPALGESQHTLNRLRHWLWVSVIAAAHAVAPQGADAHLVTVGPGLHESRALSPDHALGEGVNLSARGQVAHWIRLGRLDNQPGTNDRSCVVELLAPVAAQLQAVANPQPKEKGQDRHPGRLENFEHEHPLAFRLIELGLFLALGILIGTGGDWAALSELYRTPRDWLRDGRYDLAEWLQRLRGRP